jgi:hypothetical protein
MLKARVRGAALVEKVSVLGFTLALLFGAAQIVLSGFYQLQLDAATFFYSHSYAMTGSVATPLPAAVPVVPQGAVTTVAANPPTTEGSDANGLEVLGEYTTGGVPGGPSSGNTKRYGGASLIEPAQIASQGVLNLPSFDLSVFGHSPITITAGNIEGQSMVANHDDDSTGDPYNAAAAYGSLRNPDTATNGDDQNVPPYYLSQAFMEQCIDGTAPDYFDCNHNGVVKLAMGLAEYLQDNSNASADNGNYQNNANGIGVGQMFGAMTQHQQTYAALAQLLETSTYSTYSNSQTQTNTTGTNAVIKCAESMSNAWDLNVNSINGSGDYGTKYPLNPLAQVPC